MSENHSPKKRNWQKILDPLRSPTVALPTDDNTFTEVELSGLTGLTDEWTKSRGFTELEATLVGLDAIPSGQHCPSCWQQGYLMGVKAMAQAAEAIAVRQDGLLFVTTLIDVHSSAADLLKRVRRAAHR